MKKFYFAFLVFSFLIALTQKADAAIWYVKVGGTGNGSTWANANGNLQAVINASSPGDEIWLGSGAYTGPFTLKDNLKIYGGFEPNNNPSNISHRPFNSYSTLTVNTDDRVVKTGNGAIFDQLTISGGKALDAFGGGGVYIDGAGGYLFRNCRFISNYSYNYGGAIALKVNSGGLLRFESCLFSGNWTDRSGGVIFFPLNLAGGFETEFYSCIMQGNAAKGTYPQAGLNGAGGALAGITAAYKVKITNCTIAGNYAIGGGGISISKGFSNIVNDNVEINNSIITNNANQGFYTNPPSTSWNYSQPPPPPIFMYTGSNNILEGDAKFDQPINPIQAPTTAGIYSLKPCSPAVNTGNNTLFPNTLPQIDVKGDARFQGSQIDIGAMETTYQTASSGTIFYVDSTRPNDNGNGLSWNAAYKNLSTALFYANGYTDCVTEIRIAKGTYKNTTRSGSTDILSNYNLIGGYPNGGGARNIADNPTILSGDIGLADNASDNVYHTMIFYTTSGNFNNNTIDGFIIERGNANESAYDTYEAHPIPRNEGGGVYIYSMSPTFKNCTFRENNASSAGGAIVIKNRAFPVFENCNFMLNESTGNGGAIKITDNSGATFTNCSFNNNYSNTHGGAIALDLNSQAVFTQSFFNNNATQFGDGGAIHQQNGGFLTLEKSKFIGNQAKYGGAVRLLVGDIDFNANANVFTNNTAHENGAGALSIIPGNGKTVITNNIFTGNQTLAGVDNQVSGGASIVQEGGSTTYVINNTFYNEKSHAGTSSVHFKAGGAERYLQNNIFYQNAATGGGNLPNWSTADGTTTTASNNLENTSPMFVNAANPIGADNIWGTADDGLRLQSSSPAINQGIAANTTATDIIGNERIQDGVIDIGAYEMAPTVLPLTLTSFTAKLENNTAVLRWETSAEKDNDGFEIFRSTDAKNFVNLATLAGKGTTSIKNSYIFTDRKPLNGINYYKLVQKDKDGKTEELGVRPLTFSFNGEEVVFYPNPVKEKANVHFTAGLYKSIILSDINGRTLQNIQLNHTEAEKTITMDNLANGAYFLRLQGDGKKATVKIIKN